MDVEREIQKENAIRKIANVEICRLQKILDPFIGCKVAKVDGEIVKKLKDLLVFDKEYKIEPLTPGGFAKLRTSYVRLTTYSMMLHLDICYNGGSYDDTPCTAYCEYKHNEYYLGDIRGGILDKLSTHNDAQMLNAKAERKQYDKVEKLSKELEAEKDKLFYGLRYKN